MLAAGLLAKKAVERGLTVNAAVKTSLAPGSRVVTDYLDKTGLQPYLDQLGFQIVGYGCTTCIGNSGPLNPIIDEAITKSDLVAASVLSGNRNFEARVHPEHQGELPHVAAARRRVCARGHGRHRPRQRAARHRQGRQAGLPQGNLAHAPGNQDASQARSTARSLPQTLQRLRRAEPGLEQHPRLDGRNLRVGRKEHLYPGAALLRGLLDGAGPHHRDRRRAAARHLRRFGHDRPHLARGQLQEDFARRHLPAGKGREGGGVQQLRLAPRQRPRDDPRHLRQCAHQESHGAGRRGRRDQVSSPAANR